MLEHYTIHVTFRSLFLEYLKESVRVIGKENFVPSSLLVIVCLMQKIIGIWPETGPETALVVPDRKSVV